MNALLISALLASIFVFPHKIFAAPSPESANSYSIAERGANHRIWQRVTLHTNQLGEVRSITNSYTELETGMYYQKNGKWVETEAKIELTPNGASANKGAHKINFAANINTIGAIDFTTADGKKMRSHVLGLSYFDTATGKSALIAEIKDSIGVLTAPNRVIYPDAFTDVKADIRYTYSKAGFEQDVILREQPPSPAEYGLNVDSTRLEILTEFVESPVPVIARRKMKDGDDDQRLRFGSMSMGPGIAFLTEADGGETNSVIQGQAPPDSLPVAKQWTKMEGRTFLIESLKYGSIKPRVKDLPKREAKASTGNERVAKIKASEKRQLPVIREARSGTSKKLRVASANSVRSGFLIDYAIVSGGTDYTFKGDTTYYVSGQVYIYGTITIEGGAVVKFKPYYPEGNWLEIHAMDGLFDCKTDAYRPAVFTSRDDNSVGETITGSTGVPSVYLGCFNIGSGYAVLSNLRICYASWPTSFQSASSGGDLSNMQYVHCDIPINLEGGTATLKNVLITQCAVPLRGNGAYKVRAENVTIDNANTQLGGPGFGTIYLTNSIVVGFTNLGPATVVTNNSLVSAYPVPGLFQTVGAASYYLATNSIYRNIGTTNINGTLLTNLWSRTTYPPIVISNGYFTNDLNMFPQAQRDTDIPDLGYHYDPLDYAIGSIYFTNCNVTASNGVAIGTFSSGSTYGMAIGHGARFISEGEPHRLNYIVNYNTVQEQSNTNWVYSSPVSIYSGWVAPTPAPEASFRFTEWSMLGGVGTHFNGYNDYMPNVYFRDCQFFSGNISGSGPSLFFTNNLFARVNFSVWVFSQPDFILQNNTFYGGSFDFTDYGGDPWAFYDNLFAETDITQSFSVTNDFNAFYNVPTNLFPAGASNVVLTNLVFETGPLGDFYLATSNTKLLNSGSTTADVLSLYHYTTATNQVKETNSTVDIGFHYVAMNTNGFPFDTDRDGDPDYHEDENGNGTVDSGEPSWTSYNSLNGLTGATGIQVFTPLK